MDTFKCNAPDAGVGGACNLMSFSKACSRWRPEMTWWGFVGRRLRCFFCQHRSFSHTYILHLGKTLYCGEFTDKVGHMILVCMYVLASRGPVVYVVIPPLIDLRKCCGSKRWAVERLVLVFTAALFCFAVPFMVGVWESTYVLRLYVYRSRCVHILHFMLFTSGSLRVVLVHPCCR